MKLYHYTTYLCEIQKKRNAMRYDTHTLDTVLRQNSNTILFDAIRKCWQYLNKTNFAFVMLSYMITIYAHMRRTTGGRRRLDPAVPNIDFSCSSSGAFVISCSGRNDVQCFVLKCSWWHGVPSIIAVEVLIILFIYNDCELWSCL